MKPYNLIFTRDQKIILSNKIYSGWKEIQEEYENYMTSIDFETIDEIVNYLKIEYKIPVDNSNRLVEKLKNHVHTTFEINF